MRERIEKRLRGSAPASDPVIAALAALPAPVAQRWFDAPLVSAAVLVPLIERDDTFSILLTERMAHLRDHPGEISFPGGRVEPGDRTIADTALREADEEVGIAAGTVDIAGYLDPLAVVTGFAVTPVVGFVGPGARPRPDGIEVAATFEVPLDYLLARHCFVPVTRSVRGIDMPFIECRYHNRRIWGATALMLKSFIDLIR